MALRWSPLALLSLVVLLVAGCQLGEQQLSQCDCPSSEAIVSNIDWLGDGSIPDGTSSAKWPDGALDLTVAYDNLGNLEGATAAHDSLFDRLQAAGLMDAETPRDEIAIEVTLEDASITINAPFTIDPDADRLIEIEIGVFVADAQAAHALQPLVDALGTLD
jgi:hypothetical protein